MPAKFSSRYPLSKKDLRRLQEEASVSLGQVPIKWKHVEVGKSDDVEVYIDDGLPCLARVKGVLIPTLRCLLRRGALWIPRVIVDRGASQAVGRGADLMIPGVRNVEGDFREGTIVAIVDEQSNVAVGVGRALVDSDKLRNLIRARAKGKAVEVLHYPGDNLWDLTG